MTRGVEDWMLEILEESLGGYETLDIGKYILSMRRASECPLSNSPLQISSSNQQSTEQIQKIT